MARTAVILLSGLALVLVMAEVGYACVCVESTPREKFYESDAVFAGRVAEVKRDLVTFRDEVITFEVETSWKLVETKHVAVRNGDKQHGSCYENYRVGERYLVYAYGEDGSLATTMCFGTIALDGAGEDLSFLRERTALTLIEPARDVSHRSFAEVFRVVGIAATLLLSASLFFIRIRRRAA